MPNVDRDQPRALSYWLTPEEVVAMWGLSGLVMRDVAAGIGRARREGWLSEEGWALEFYGGLGSHRDRIKMFLGFAQARPLSEGDRTVLGDLLHLSPGSLVSSDDPVEMYEVSRRLNSKRAGSGHHRVWFAKRTSDPEAVLALLGMASVMRVSEVSTLRQIAHAAYLDDPVVAARGWASAFPLAVKR